MVSYAAISPVIAAYNSLIEMIADGLLRPGEHLHAKMLSERFGMSRTPVLEALRKLENEGVVRFKPGNGAWLANPTAAEIEDLYIVRKELELLALRECFDDIRTTDIIELRKSVLLEREYFRLGDKTGAFKAGLDFHRELISACSNKYLVSLIEHALTTTFLYLLMFERELGETDDTHPDDHAAILDLIEKKEADKALDYLDRHIHAACHHDFQRN